MKKTILIVLTIISANFIQAQDWVLNAEFSSTDGSDYGSSIDLNANGDILAIGASTNGDAGGTYAGLVRVFQKNGNTWTQMGNDLTGDVDGDLFGESLSLSDDGLTLAVGAPSNSTAGTYYGQIKIFHFDGTNWVQVGSDIYGSADYESIGSEISLNADGTILASGSASSADANGYNAGKVSVYQFNGTSWDLMGNPIDGVAQYDYFGYSVSISADGLTVAAGASSNDDAGNAAGHTRVFHFNGVSWVQLGNTLTGADSGDRFGDEVCLNDAGDKLAVDAPYAGSNYGTVGLYQINGSTWTQEGTNLTGDDEWSSFGRALAFNQSGSRLVIGLESKAKVYDMNNGIWAQVGQVIQPVQYMDYFGSVISISHDGNVLAVGGAGGNNYVAVYMLASLPQITAQPQNLTNVCPGTSVDYTVSADNATAYQWQVSTDNGTTWDNIHDTNVYSGTDTPTLTIVADVYVNNYQYRCVVSNSSSSVETDAATLQMDDEQPVINTSFTDVSIDADWQCEASLPDYIANIDVTDNCTAFNDLTITQSPAGGTTITGDTNTVTISVTDETGNTTQTTFNVAVVDNSPPVISSTLSDDYIDAVYNCQAQLPDYTTAVVTADNCSSNITITQTPSPGISISGDNNPVTITVTDEVGNAHSVSFNVSVVDDTAPWYDSFPNTQLVDAGANCEAALPDYTTQITVHDNCTTPANMIISQTPVAGTMISGSNNPVVVTITDEAGNQNTLNLDVSVVDNTAPVISSSPGDQTLDAGANCEAVMPDLTGNVVATDNCTATDMLTLTQFPAAGSMVSDYTTASITITDEAGNSSSTNFMIYVVDNMPPVFLSTHDDQVIDAGDNCEAALPDYTIYVNGDDNCMFNFMPVQTPAPGTMISGDTNTVTLTIEDEAGNQASVSFNVAVEDNTPPVILTYVDNQMVTANGPDGYTVQGTEFDIQDMSDNCGIASVVNDFNNQSTLDGALLPVGVTDIIWTVTDNAGNETTNNFYVDVSPYVGMDDLSQAGISVYPNPFNENIRLNLGDAQVQQIILQDISGKLIWQSQVNGEDMTIDTRSLQAGVYLLRISTEKGMISAKLIKE